MNLDKDAVIQVSGHVPSLGLGLRFIPLIEKPMCVLLEMHIAKETTNEELRELYLSLILALTGKTLLMWHTEGKDVVFHSFDNSAYSYSFTVEESKNDFKKRAELLYRHLDTVRSVPFSSGISSERTLSYVRVDKKRATKKIGFDLDDLSPVAEISNMKVPLGLISSRGYGATHKGEAS